MGENYKLARERVGIITAIIGEVVGSLLAIIFYFTFLIPFALITKLSSDHLQRHVSGNQFWLQREAISNELEKAKRQG